MSKEKTDTPVANWNFVVTVDNKKISEMFCSPINRHHFVSKRLIRALGMAVEYGDTFLEKQHYHCLPDGTLKKEAIAGLPLKILEIEITEPDNVAWLSKLEYMHKCLDNDI